MRPALDRWYRRPVAIEGIWGRPFLELSGVLDLSALPEVHEEICLALTQVPLDYTGGCHRSMGIMPRALEPTAHRDYGEVLRGMSERERRTFASLSDDPAAAEVMVSAADPFELVGEERELALSRRQMLWLEVRYGVYFPWKGYVELIPNKYWDDKADPRGKDFTRAAKTFFPKTLAFVRSLPFESIGRCNVMGLASNDHGTVHRDGEPKGELPGHFITFVPAATAGEPGPKRLFLYDDESGARLPVEGRAYWFNDADYHGVEADPYFRYSVRVDGVFRPDFLATLEARARETSAPREPIEQGA